MVVGEPDANYISGWVKIFRSLTNKGWYQNSEFVHLWIHLLIKANHKPANWTYKEKNMSVNRGQFITSRRSLSKETGISESNIERILRCFKNEQQIEQQNLFTSRLISIVNYDVYQISEQDFEQRTNSELTASEQPTNTNKNISIKESKKKYIAEGSENFKKFVAWCKDNVPRVLSLKQPITEPQFLKLKEKFPVRFIQDVLSSMQNHKALTTKYVSAYATFLNWAERRDVAPYLKNANGHSQQQSEVTSANDRLNPNNYFGGETDPLYLEALKNTHHDNGRTV